MFIDRKTLSHFDWAIFVILALILGIGIISIYSVTYQPSANGGTPLYLKQIYWICIGLFFFALMAWVDYHEIIRFAYAAYGLSIFLLLVVLLIGPVVQGSRRWLPVGTFSLQPSEVAKVTLLLVLAKYFSENSTRRGLSFWQLFVPGFLMLVPMLMVLKQPDLGTALVLTSIFFTMVFMMGVRSRFLIYSIFVFLMLFPFLWLFFWTHLKDYQKERLLTFLNPTSDPMGTGYHIIQSKIAVGSGGLMGKGLFGGTQSQLKFLPEGHTDFIFSVFAEQWGFLGVFVLFSLYLLLFLWGVEIAFRAKDPVGTLLAAGVVGLLSFYVVVNIGMALGVMPVVGVPLPLMSYGGTSMVTTLALLGLLLNVKMRRFMLFY